MQRLFSLKKGTKFIGERYDILSPHSRTFPSPIRANPNQSVYHSPPLPRPYRTFSHFATASHSEKICGFFANPRILKQLEKFRIGFFKAQLRRRSFGFNSSFRAHSRDWKSWVQRQTPHSVVLGLILTNVAVFMLWRIADRQFMLKNFTISLENFRSGRVHTMITSAFSQVDTGHLITNMIGLYFFGNSIGRNFGPSFLLNLYLAGAFVGSVFFLVHKGFMALYPKNYGGRRMDVSRILGMGASGAVNAIMLLDIFLFPKATLYFDFIIPVPAILLGIFLIGKDMLRILEGDREISGSAHLGGAVVAALWWARIRKGRI